MLDLIFVILVLSMALSNRKSAMACDTPMFSWLIVFACIVIARSIKNLVAVFAMNNRELDYNMF